MNNEAEVRTVGGYRLARELQPSAFGQRWLARHEEKHTDWILHAFDQCEDKAERVLLLSWIETADGFEHAHLPSIRRVASDERRVIWAAEPYLGSEDGLLTLDQLLALKGGRMSPAESERVLIHVLDAMRYAHELGICNGPLTAADLLVDRHGSVTIDLYGLRRRLDGLMDIRSEVILDEVRSAAMMGYWALTGLEAEEPRIPAGRLVRRLDRAWDDWFEVALDPAGGFSTARDALDHLPTRGGRAVVETKPGAARVVLERLRTAWSGSTGPSRER